MKTLLISELLAGYHTGRFTPAQVIEAVLARIEAAPERNVWITRLSREEVMRYVDDLQSRAIDAQPLYGVPFAIKDNADLAGTPTTAACAQYAYVPQQSATVVRKLIAAGAIPIGKTNLDQFATGLVGTRSPYGACANSFDAQYISGGSSSGSAVAVASALVSFALGTDTAGSGRVPAAFNNIVGLKPSCGLLSTSGVVPACRSLDTVSIFALTAQDAQRVLAVARGFDASDSYSRDFSQRQVRRARFGDRLRIGIPRRSQLCFFGDDGYEQCFDEVLARLSLLGWSCVEVDFAPFVAAARLLYEGPWIAERYAALAEFMDAHADAMHPVTRSIVSSGRAATAADAFRAQYRLKEIQRACEPLWREIDLLLTPTVGSIYTIAQVLADPQQLNANLGYYTNFVNLLDLAAIAVPGGIRADGLPFGVTLIAPSGSDSMLLQYGAQLHAACAKGLGATGEPVPAPAFGTEEIEEGFIGLVVCGAHLSGLPLNHQLQDRDAYLVRRSRTAASYKLYALPGGPPKRPGLVRVREGGAAIEVELWAVPHQHLGSFVGSIPAPLGIGKIELEDGSWHSGFLSEAHALESALDITPLAGWRSYVEQAGKA
jgi:allophanate hydrolase